LQFQKMCTCLCFKYRWGLLCEIDRTIIDSTVNGSTMAMMISN